MCAPFPASEHAGSEALYQRTTHIARTRENTQRTYGRIANQATTRTIHFPPERTQALVSCTRDLTCYLLLDNKPASDIISEVSRDGLPLLNSLRQKTLHTACSPKVVNIAVWRVSPHGIFQPTTRAPIHRYCILSNNHCQVYLVPPSTTMRNDPFLSDWWTLLLKLL